MPERKIQPVTDGVDKEATYKTQFERYDKAVKNGFYFEAMLIVYAIMEDRLRAWLFYLGCLNTCQSTRFDNKRSKNELKFMFDGCENDKFRFPSINQISGKRKIIEATLIWAENGYNNADKSNYLCAIRKVYTDKLDIKKVRVKFIDMNEWCSYRNEVIHALMNKNTESLNSGLADRVSEGMDIARDFDNLVKKIKRSGVIRKSLNLNLK